MRIVAGEQRSQQRAAPPEPISQRSYVGGSSRVIWWLLVGGRRRGGDDAVGPSVSAGEVVQLVVVHDEHQSVAQRRGVGLVGRPGGQCGVLDMREHVQDVAVALRLTTRVGTVRDAGTCQAERGQGAMAGGTGVRVALDETRPLDAEHLLNRFPGGRREEILGFVAEELYQPLLTFGRYRLLVELDLSEGLRADGAVVVQVQYDAAELDGGAGGGLHDDLVGCGGGLYEVEQEVANFDCGVVAEAVAELALLDKNAVEVLRQDAEVLQHQSQCLAPTLFGPVLDLQLRVLALCGPGVPSGALLLELQLGHGAFEVVPKTGDGLDLVADVAGELLDNELEGGGTLGRVLGESLDADAAVFTEGDLGGLGLLGRVLLGHGYTMLSCCARTYFHHGNSNH